MNDRNLQCHHNKQAIRSSCHLVFQSEQECAVSIMLQSTSAAAAGAYRRTRFPFLVAAFFLATNLYSQVEASSPFSLASTTAWGVGAPALSPTSAPTDSSKGKRKKSTKRRRTITAKGGRNLDGFEKSPILSDPCESSSESVSGRNKVGHKKKLKKKKSKHHTRETTGLVTQVPLAGRRNVAESTKPASGVKHMKKVKKHKSKTRGASSVVDRVGSDASILKIKGASLSKERAHKKKKIKKSHKTSSSKAGLEKGSSTSPKSHLPVLGSSESRSLKIKKSKKKKLQHVKGEVVAVSVDQVKSRKKKMQKRKKGSTGVAHARSELPGDDDSAIKSSSTDGVSHKKKKTKGKRKHSTQTKVQTDAEAPGDESWSVVEVSPIIGDGDTDLEDGEGMEDREVGETEPTATIQISVEAEPQDSESLENIDSTARLDVVVEDAGAILPQTEDLEEKDLEVGMRVEGSVTGKESEPSGENEATDDCRPKEGELTIGTDGAEIKGDSETEGDSSKADETPGLDDATATIDVSFSPSEIEQEPVEVAEKEIAESIEASVVGDDDTTEPEIQNVGQAMEESDKSESGDAFVGDEYKPSLLETRVAPAQQKADPVKMPLEAIADEVATDESESGDATTADEYEPSFLESHAQQKTAEEVVTDDRDKSAEPTSETRGAGEGTNTGMENNVSSGLCDNLGEDTDEPDILTFIGKILHEDVRSWVEEPEEDKTSDENESPQLSVSSEKDISEDLGAKKLESGESVGDQVNEDTESKESFVSVYDSVSDKKLVEDSEEDEDEDSDGEDEEDAPVRHTANPNYVPTVSTSTAPLASPNISIGKEAGSSTKMSSAETVANVADDSKNSDDEAGLYDAVASDKKSLAVDERPISSDVGVDTEVSKPSEPESRIDRSSLESSEDSKTDIAVSVVTWNLAEESPAENDATFIRKFRASGIHHKTGSDLVLISGQECENIKPRRTEGSRSREFRRLMVKMLGKEYVPIALHLLGGIQFGLFAKRSFLKEIEFVGLSDVTCGIGNVFHNKGAIAAYVQVKARNPSSEKDKTNDGSAISKSLRIMFVTAHMAAHVKNSDARDSDFWRISSELEAQAPERIFPLSSVTKAGTDTGSPLFDSMDRVFFCGDLNYRVDLPRELTEHAVSQIAGGSGEVSEELRLDLLRHDQLIRSMAERRAFPGFAEGKIYFAPTFKFDKGTDEYDTSHKQRIPAWTDRILFKPLGTRVLEYSSVEDAQHSDHRPVYGTFRVNMEGRQMPKLKRKKSKPVSRE
jgi:hypothetical protein